MAQESSKQAYEERMASEMEDLNTRYRQLHEQAKGQGLETVMEALRAKSESAAQQLDALKARGQEEWQDLKGGMDKQWQDLHEDLDILSHQLKHSRVPASLYKLLAMKMPLWVGLLLLLPIIGLLSWNQQVLNRLGDRDETVQALQADRQSLANRAMDLIARRDEAAQRRFGTALGWALGGNPGMAERILKDLADTPHTRSAVLANQDGRIIAAGDPKLRNSEFGKLYPAALLRGKEVEVRPATNGDRLLVVPVTSLGTRLGTVVVSYAPEPVGDLGS